MLSQEQISIVKSTIPLLESVGPTITNHFYARMFKHTPELQHIFNMSHQHSGKQAVALFSAIAAYAKYIDNLPVLQNAVERIAQKHTSFSIQPHHYDIVGEHLLATLRELAPEAFTAEVESAWSAAYNQLASVFIAREGDLYAQHKDSRGGWEGPRRFLLTEKRLESELVKSCVFTPVDGKPVMDYIPGQYIGIRVKPQNNDFDEIRQYTLSTRPNGNTYQISVKREIVGAPGVVSNFLHDNLRLGDEVELFAPAGDFFWKDNNAPVVCISAGVGSTPMQAILAHLAEIRYQQPVFYLHACESPEQHSFVKNVNTLSATLNLESHTWYKHEHSRDTFTHHGLMDISILEETLPLQTGDFYLCGPVAFMQFAKQQLFALGVNETQIHYEVFGPHEAF